MAAREWGPDEALDRLEAALSHFQEAQAELPGHPEGNAGSARCARPCSSFTSGKGSSARSGRERLDRRDPQAASSLTTALDHFEAALSLNANNVPARNGAEEARRLLPEALVLGRPGRAAAGDRAEPSNTRRPWPGTARRNGFPTGARPRAGSDPGTTGLAGGRAEAGPDAAAPGAGSTGRPSSSRRTRPSTRCSIRSPNANPPPETDADGNHPQSPASVATLAIGEPERHPDPPRMIRSTNILATASGFPTTWNETVGANPRHPGSPALRVGTVLAPSAAIHPLSMSTRPKVIVTGASSGIGRATAVRFAAVGMRCASTPAGRTGSSSWLAACRPGASRLPGDYSDPSVITRMEQRSGSGGAGWMCS